MSLPNQAAQRLLIILGTTAHVALAACTSEPSGPPAQGAGDCAPTVLRGMFTDPARTLSVPCGTTHDIDTDVASVLERGQLADACARHFARLDDRTGKLPDAAGGDPAAVSDLVRCGKSLFVFGGLSTGLAALPENVLKALHATFPSEVGARWSRIGLVADPDDDVLPVGIVATPPEQVPDPVTGRKMTFTCVACHAARLPDGRFAMGAANTALDLGKFNALGMFPLWLMDPDHPEASWPEQTLAYYARLEALVHESDAPESALFETLARLSPEQAAPLLEEVAFPTIAESRSYLRGGRGRFNPYAPLVSIEDRELYVVPPSLWNVLKYADDVESKIDTPAGDVAPFASLEDFVRAGLYLTYLNPEVDQTRYVDALSAYVRTLRAPRNPKPRDPQRLEAGRSLFEAHCRGCHDGPRGETLALFPLEEEGSPEALRSIFLDYMPPNARSVETYGWLKERFPAVYGAVDRIASRPLQGMWARERFFINGGAASLDALFCLDGPRGVDADASDPLTDAVHLDLCDHYDEDERRALLAFLSAW